MGTRLTTMPVRDPYMNRTYYLFGNLSNSCCKCFKDQQDLLKGGKISTPRIQPNYFIIHRQEFPSAVQTLTAAGYTSDSKENDETATNSTQEDASQELPPQKTRSGYIIVDIDKLIEFIQKIQDHCLSCGHQMELEKSMIRCFNHIMTWHCKFCSMTLTQAFDDDAGLKTGGRRYTKLGLTIAEAAFESGISPTKCAEFFANAGIASPPTSTLARQFDRVKENAKPISMEQLRENRRKHVAACRALPNYPGDVKYVDKTTGRQCSIARGAAAGDGMGTRRCYNHHITGDQHLLVIESLVTCEPLWLACDQLSCYRCQLQMAEYLKRTGLHATDVQPGTVDLTHPGKCYRNTVHGPATAEEYAWERAGYELLDAEDDDEKIFLDEVCSDGDTRGVKRFISAQIAVIGDAVKGLAEQDPDGGHLIKCISNGYYDTAEHDKSLKGAGLLEPTRIRAISSDVGKHIRTFHNKLASLEMTPNDLALARSACLKAMGAIIPHHCGNHKECDVSYCKYLQLKRRLEAAYFALDVTKSQMELENEVRAEYAKVARFRGRLLSLNKSAQDKVSRVITSRLNEKNIDRVAKLLSSNRCENFFNVLTKHTEGKRRYLGRKDTFEVTAYFAAGLISNPELATKLLERMGIESSNIRDRARQQLAHKKETAKKRKSTPAYNESRVRRKQVQLARMAKEGKSASRHQPHKLSPTDDCKAKKETPKKRKRTPSCVSCGQKGHWTKECREMPNGGVTRKRTKTAALTADKILDLFH